MAYQPQIQVVDATKFRDNLTEHIKAMQTDVLTWANRGRVLPEIVNFYKAPTLVRTFPSLTWLQISHESKWEEILEIDFSMVAEVAIVHGKADILADRGPKYSMALESMLVNVPETTFNDGSIIDITSTSMDVKTTFEVQAKFKNQFISIFQTRASWRIEASAYANPELP